MAFRRTLPRFVRDFRSGSKTSPRPRSSNPTNTLGPYKLRREDKHFKISKEVTEALQSRRPIVALETTIYTHGFPYPDNVALALDLESIVRKNGGVPATIGILDGVATVGMTTEELRRITASAGNPETMKVSRRDLPYILGLGFADRKLNGGTTIAGTMFLAHRAGIKVFGTGGLGGVHRGGQDTMDVSADLTELGRTPVAVISSGCKSFLDLPRTLEYLETQGTGVFTFADGRTGDIDFPAFYTRDSGVKSPMVVQNEKEAAAMIYSQAFFPGSSGLLFANPIPEDFSIPKSEINSAIDQAVEEAAEQGFHGHANTPFILARIKELTKGNSIPANRALIESNVAVATKVAVELSELRHSLFDTNPMISESFDDTQSTTVFRSLSQSEGLSETRELQTVAMKESRPKVSLAPSSRVDVVVYGSVAMDLSCNYIPPSHRTDATSEIETSTTSEGISPQLHTSNIANISPSVGGVGHNVTLAVQRAGGGKVSVRLCSAIADDLAGNAILTAMTEEGLDTSGITTLPTQRAVETKKEGTRMYFNRTAQYVAINDAKKDLVLAMADMSICNSTVPLTSHHRPSSVKWIVVDANWSPWRIRKLMATSGKAKVAFEPVSVAKAAQLFQPDVEKSTAVEENSIPVEVFPNNIVDLATPNQYELAAMHASAKKHEFFESNQWWEIIDAYGIPSTGARDRFVALTSHKMTDEGIPLQAVQLLPFIPTIITKLGSEGVLLTELLEPHDPRLTEPLASRYILSRNTNGNTRVGGVYMRHFPAAKNVDDVVSVNGVGDTFLGVLIAGLARGLEVERLINISQRGAVMTLRSPEAVSPGLGSLSRLLDRATKAERDDKRMDEILLAAAGFDAQHD